MGRYEYSSIRLLIREFLWFGVKQAYACIFGGLLLAAILLSKFLWSDELLIHRYDFLFFIALLIQILLIVFKLETKDEVKVIFVFHVVGTVMELFKTHVDSWSYPEEAIIRIAGVPLFSGFMYSAVGSYIARVWNIFDFRFTAYPKRSIAILLSILIYVNFFSHHYVWDIRYALFAGVLFYFWRTQVFFKSCECHRQMPLVVGWALVAFFIWIAENVGTFGTIWAYPNQHDGWDFVSISKIGSWFLLMIISFVLVTLIKPIQGPNHPRN